jgi:hypothetical protein
MYQKAFNFCTQKTNSANFYIVKIVIIQPKKPNLALFTPTLKYREPHALNVLNLMS